MRNVIKSLVVVVALLFGTTAYSEEANKGYTLLIPALPTSTKKIEVLEFFSYQCSHCYHLHGHLSAWAKKMPKDVELTYVPVPHFQRSWGLAARTYYALEGMGKIKLLDDAIYDAINKRRPDLYDIDSYADFVASKGVDRAIFVDAVTPTSFSGGIVEKKIKAAAEMTKRYSIEGTPTLVIDGKLVVQAHADPADTIRALDAAIAKARKERSKK